MKNNQTELTNVPAETAGESLYEWVRALVSSVLAVVLIFTVVVRLIGVDGHSMSGSYRVRDEILEQIRDLFWAGSCGEEATAAAIAHYYKDCGYLIDTHTAVAADVMAQYRAATGDAAPTVFVSTASPFKFCDSVLKAIGETPKGEGIDLIDQLQYATGRPAPCWGPPVPARRCLPRPWPAF